MNAAASDVALDDLRINGGKTHADVTAAVTDTSLDQTISGASTLTLDLHDPERVLLRSELMKDRTTVALDDLTFELAAVRKQGNLLTVTFEDYAVAQLRRHKNVVKAAAGTTSRVEFCRRLIRKDEPWIVVDGPQSGPTILEEISTGQTTTTSSLAAVDRPSGGKEQLSAVQVAQYAYDAGFRGVDLVTAVAVSHAESGFDAARLSPVNSDGSRDQGLWQINDKAHPQYTRSAMFDPVQNAKAAFSVSSGGHNWAPWTTYNNGAYRQYLSDAQAAVDQVKAKGATSLIPGATTSTTSSESTKPEDHWSAVNRIMAEINWRVFARRGHIVIAPDEWLLKQAGITIRETDEAVDSIDFDVDRGKKVSTVTVTCRASRWGALPGEPVTVAEMGPADDTWLLSDISRPLTSTTATVSLVKKRKTLPEPAQNTSDAGVSGVGTTEKPRTLGSAKPDVRRMVDFALGQQGDHYVMGGNGPNQWDCSGLVLAATVAGGHSIGARTADSQYQACKAAGRLISVASAMVTCGALLFGAGSDGTATAPGHVAISLGNGQTMQARGTAYGVGVFTVPDSEWSFAALAPGFTY